MRKTACRSLLRVCRHDLRIRLRQVDYTCRPSRVKTRLADHDYGSPSRTQRSKHNSANTKCSLLTRQNLEKFFRRTESVLCEAEYRRICEANSQATTRDMQTSSSVFTARTSNCAKRNLRTCRSLVRTAPLRLQNGVVTRPPQTSTPPHQVAGTSLRRSNCGILAS